MSAGCRRRAVMARRSDRPRRRDGAGPKRKAGKKGPRAAAPEASPPAVGTDARAAFFEQAGQYTRYLGVETDDGRFVVDTRSRGMGRHLFSKQGRPEFRVLRRAVTVVEALIGDDAIT